MSDLKYEAELFLAIMKAFQVEKNRQTIRNRASIVKTGDLPEDYKASKTFIRTIMHITKKSQKETEHEFNSFDNEGAHITEDDLKNRFIKQLASGSIQTTQIKPIAQVLDKISKLQYDRWYA